MTLFCKVGVDGFVASVVLGVGNYFLSLLAPLFVDKVCMGWDKLHGYGYAYLCTVKIGVLIRMFQNSTLVLQWVLQWFPW